MAADCNTRMAMQRVFNTAELFELILVDVDVKTILLAQRVNSDWQGTIAKSSRLQKRLFFKAAIPEDLYLLRLANPDADGYTLVVRQSSFEAATRDRLGVAGISVKDYAQSNPFFPRVAAFSCHYGGELRSKNLRIERLTFKLPKGNTGAEAIRPSWMRMFITQPPNVPCWMPDNDGHPAVAQHTFTAFGTKNAPCKTVAMCGHAMRGKYYWDAVERSIEASAKTKEVEMLRNMVGRVAIHDTDTHGRID